MIFLSLNIILMQLKIKKLILEQKLELIKNGEFDAARKERVKRQLTDLELKRCKALLGKKRLLKNQ